VGHFSGHCPSIDSSMANEASYQIFYSKENSVMERAFKTATDLDDELV